MSSSAEPSPVSAEDISVLLVEDDEDDALIVRQLLRSLEHLNVELDWRASYETGLDAILGGGHDIYLIDYRLGARSGVDLLRETTGAGALAPMIILTGQGDRGVDLEAMNAGAADYLVKRKLDRDSLERSIRYSIERHRALAALRVAEERFRNAFENAPIGMVLLEETGRLTQLNPAVCKMLGYTEDELKAMTLEDLIHEEEREATRTAMEHLLAGSVPAIDMIRRYIRADETVAWGQTSASVSRETASGPFIVVQLVDITDLKSANRRLQDLLDTRDQFLDTVSHELRTPLTAVVGFAELLQREAGLSDPDRSEMINTIAEQALDLSDIVANLLVAARSEAGTLSVVQVPVDLAAQVRQVQEVLQRKLCKPLEVIGAEAKALADPGRVHQVIRNLLINASEYGGNEIWIELHQSESRATLRVIDDGPGIPSDVRQRIFEPYYHSNGTLGTTGSLGLGLTVSKALTKLMGGDLQYRHEKGRSIFEMRLPALRPTVDRNPQGSQQPWSEPNDIQGS